MPDNTKPSGGGGIIAELKKTKDYAIDPSFIERLRQKLLRQFKEAMNAK